MRNEIASAIYSLLPLRAFESFKLSKARTYDLYPKFLYWKKFLSKSFVNMALNLLKLISLAIKMSITKRPLI